MIGHSFDRQGTVNVVNRALKQNVTCVLELANRLGKIRIGIPED
jgi:hypothetical protein